jgi:hypothetical protein
MNQFEIFEEGRKAYNPRLSVYEANPYQRQEDRGMGVLAFQNEATPFFNGWEKARGRREHTEGYSLFLDDFRFPNWVNWIALPSQNWLIARHYYEFVKIIEMSGLPRFVTFDFDLDRHAQFLGDLPYKNGLDCAEYMIEYCIKHGAKFPNFAVHSTNHIYGPAIAKRIWEYIKG